MTGAGTDKTKTGFDLNGPAMILVEPQLGVNIGMAARAMGNFALCELRIVNPRDGWPNIAAQRAAAGADHVLDRAKLFKTLAEAVADLDLLFATTARAHDQAKPVVGPETAAREVVEHLSLGGRAGILFGRERWGLTNEEVGRANRIITFPVNPGFASLNLAQAVLLIGYEWFAAEDATAAETLTAGDLAPATKDELLRFFLHLEEELDRTHFMRNEEKRPSMVRNLRNLFQRAGATEQELRTLHGVITALAGPRRRAKKTEDKI